MNLVVDRRTLHAGLSAVGRAATVQSSLAILKNVKFEAVGQTLRLTASDLELVIERVLDNVNVQTPGGCTLPAKTLCDIVGSLPDGEVTIQVDEQHAGTITCGKSVYRIHGLPTIEFPPTPEVANAASFIVHEGTLLRGLKAVLSGVSTDDTRPVLTGVFLKLAGSTAVLVATDTHRLVVVECPIQGVYGSTERIIPGRALREWAHLLDANGDATVKIELGENEVRFTVGSTVLTSRLIEGTFPKYERVIPTKSDFRLTINADEFCRAVKRAGIVARDNANRVEIRYDAKTLLTVSATAGDTGSACEELDIEDVAAPDIAFCMNSAYLLDALGAVGGSQITLDGTKPLEPFVLRAVGDESRFVVIMPMSPA